MNTVLSPQFCVACSKQLEIAGVPEVIPSVNLLKLKFNCVLCKTIYSVTWNYKTNFYTKFKEVS